MYVLIIGTCQNLNDFRASQFDFVFHYVYCDQTMYQAKGLLPINGLHGRNPEKYYIRAIRFNNNS